MRKYASYILILIILVGLCSPTARVSAQAAASPTPTSTSTPAATSTDAVAAANAKAAAAEAAAKTTTNDNDAFKQGIIDGCGASPWTWFNGCLLLVFYYTYFQLPTFLLWLSAQIFNVFISIGLSSDMTSSSTFLANAWAVVRDLSNIFFILILLYIAIKLILGIGGSEVKKMIANVVIMALLINFSMFFTKIVIDSSNILALVFYNKLDINTSREYTSSTENNEKDVTGQMYAKFDATRLVGPDFMQSLKTSTINGQTVVSDQLPFALTFAMIVIAGSMMLWAAYAFFVSGFMFLGRLIELWVLIIFSPFAFMSFTIPTLRATPYIGWDEWSKRLIATSFMAPIFMFFIYLIFLLLNANIFGSFINGKGFVATILGVLIPEMIIMGLLLKAVKYAEKGGGQFGEFVMKGAKMVGGLAVTAAAAAATGGTALALRAGLGAGASSLASSKGLQDAAKATGIRGIAGRMALRTVDYGSKASFDVRNAPALVRDLSKRSAFAVQQGGYTQARAEKVKKRQERAKQLEVREDEEFKQKLNTSEQDLQKMLNLVTKDFEGIDKELVSARQAKADSASGSKEEKDAIDKIEALNKKKKAIKEGTNLVGPVIKVKGGANDGKTISELEKAIIPEQKNQIVKENRERRWKYAERIEGREENSKMAKIMFWRRTRTNREAAYKVRMEAKIESSGGDHGGGGHAAPKAHAPVSSPSAPAAPKAAPSGGGGGGHGPAH